MSTVMKRTVVRLLLFGIPFGLSYWATRPVTPQTAAGQSVVVCVSSGDLPGELHIKLDTHCPDPNRISVVASPATTAHRRPWIAA